MDRLKSAGSALKEKIETEAAGMQEELRDELAQRIETIENDLGRFDAQSDQLSAEAQQQCKKLRPEIVQAKDELLDQLQQFTKDHPEEWREIRGELVRKGKDLMRLWQQAKNLFAP